MSNLFIDVSHHQGAIRFDDVVKDKHGISACIIKATEGQNYVDPQLKYNAFEAKKAGLKVGYYHFATLNTPDVVTDAIKEAEFFTKTIMGVPPPDLPLVLDIETNKAGLTPELVQKWIKEFFAYLEAARYNDFVLYSYTPFLNVNLPKNHQLGNIKLWVAHYTNALVPRLPDGWKDYWAWQYTAKARINGIATDCDMNRLK